MTSKKVSTARHQFIQVRKKNESQSNLTELNAFESADRGFVSHSDWTGHIMRYGHAMKVIEKTKPKSILDVGCGDLNLAKFLWRNRSQFKGKYVGLDLRAQASWLDGITWDVPMDLIRMDIVLDDPRKVGGPFDVVVNFEMFEHVPRASQKALLGRLFDWTRPGGLCLFSTPNAGVAKSTADNHIGEDGIRERTYDEKLVMVKNVGFVVERTYGTFCGSTRLPKDFLELPHIKVLKEYLMDSFFVSVAAVNFPERSNNALFVMRRPG